MMKYSICFGLIISIFSCKKAENRQLPFYNTSDFTPNFSKNVPANFHKIRPFKLLSQNNETITEQNLNGKIVVGNFFFTTCPGICPKMTTNMKILQQEFLNDKNILLLSHSVTPDKDDVARLQIFAQKNKINSNQWKLLTGSKSEIYDLGRKFYFVEEDLGEKRDSSVFLHTENFILLDKNRHIRGIYNGLSIDAVQNLIEDIKVLSL
jgi:protein SCO1